MAQETCTCTSRISQEMCTCGIISRPSFFLIQVSITQL